MIPGDLESTEHNPNLSKLVEHKKYIQGFPGFSLPERATGNLKCSQKHQAWNWNPGFIPKGNSLELPVPGDGAALPTGTGELGALPAIKIGICLFFPIFQPEQVGSCSSRSTWQRLCQQEVDLGSPRSCYRGFGDNDPPLELQTAPGGLQALPQEALTGSRGTSEVLEVLYLWKALPIPLLLFLTLGIQGFSILAHLGPSPIPWDLLRPMECFRSNAHSMQENLGMRLDAWEGAGWTNLRIRMERDCSWSPDPTKNPQRWSWKSLGEMGAAGISRHHVKVEAIKYY